MTEMALIDGDKYSTDQSATYTAIRTPILF